MTKTGQYSNINQLKKYLKAPLFLKKEKKSSTLHIDFKKIVAQPVSLYIWNCNKTELCYWNCEKIIKNFLINKGLISEEYSVD